MSEREQLIRIGSYAQVARWGWHFGAAVGPAILGSLAILMLQHGPRMLRWQVAPPQAAY